MGDWFNDNTYQCDNCKAIFKVFCLDEEPHVDFCPICACRDLTAIEEDDFEIKE